MPHPRPPARRPSLCNYHEFVFLFVFLELTQLLLSTSAWGQIDAQRMPEVMSQLAPILRFERFSIEDGMAQSTASAILQDRKGFLWIGTQAGLHKFDGHEFEVFEPVPFDTTSIGNSFVTDLSLGIDNQIWVATEQGLYRFDPATEHSRHYLYDPGDSSNRSINYFTSILATRDGDVWAIDIGSKLYRIRMDEDERVEHFQLRSDDSGTPAVAQIAALTEDPDGYVWIGSTNGIIRIDPESGLVTRYLKDPEDLPSVGFSATALKALFPPDDRRTAWVTTSNGLVRLDIESGAYERYLVEPNRGGYNPNNRLSEIESDPVDPNILWAGGPNVGLVRFDMRTKKFSVYRHDPSDPNSLSSNRVVSIFQDRFGTMWVGTEDKGLNLFNPRSVDFVHLRSDPNDPQTLAPGGVFGMLIDKWGSLWAATEETTELNYLTHFDARTGLVTRYRHRPMDPRSIRPGAINAMVQDSRGDIWLGHARGGVLSRVNPVTGEATSYKFEPVGTAQLGGIGSLLVSPSESNTLWVGSFSGMLKLDIQSGSSTHIPIGPASDYAVYAIHEDADGVVWVGSRDGLHRVDHDKGRLVATYESADTTSLSGPIVLYIAERSREPGVLWLATSGGLDRYDTRTGIATHFTGKDGLPSNTIYNILEDEAGTLWMSTNNGISNFDPNRRTFRNYGLDDGLRFLEYNQGASGKSPDGRFYFGGYDGITVFAPGNLSTNEIPPSVAFTDFKLFNHSVEVGPGSPLKQPLSETNQITLAHDQNEITFEFVGLHFGNSGKNRYAYQLEGHDPEMIDAGFRRSASYTNLPAGSYTFHVIASNSDGVWNQVGASIALRVTPPWWATWWAYLLFAGMIGAAIWGGARYQRHRLVQSEAERARVREIQIRAEAQQRRREDAERLSEIGKAITSTLSIREIIDTVYEHVNALMDASVFGIGIYNPRKERLEFPVMKEKGKTLPPFVNDLDDDGRPAVWCFKNVEAFVVGDFEKEYTRYLPTRKAPEQGEDPRSIIYLPLVHHEKVVGVITTQSFERNAYTDYDVSVLRTLATYAAIALDNAESYRRLDATLNELRSTQEQLVQQEKLASLGALTAGIAHEIKNPLNFVNNFSSLSAELVGELKEVLRSGSKQEVDAILSDLELNVVKIEEHGKRADSIVRNMMAHARGGRGERRAVDLNAFVAEYADLAYHGQRARNPDFSAHVMREFDQGAGTADIMPQEMGRVLLNLLSNAFDAVAENAVESTESANGSDRHEPTIRIGTRRDGEHVEIWVEDDGPGITEDIRAKIFEPFFTTKPAGSGTGLGLSLSHDIVTKGHGGSLKVESTVGKGTIFTIRLPANGASDGDSTLLKPAQEVQ